jgi:hypothetical protein
MATSIDQALCNAISVLDKKFIQHVKSLPQAERESSMEARERFFTQVRAMFMDDEAS